MATAGDTVAVTPTGLLVNGALVPNSRPLLADRKGRTLPQLAVGVYTVDRGELWAVSSYSRFSFDSRYFGAVTTSDVQSRLSPLWTASY